jgi:hypothetical protein
MYHLTLLWLAVSVAAFVAGRLQGTRGHRVTDAQLRALLAATRSMIERDDCEVALGTRRSRAGDTQGRARIRCAWAYQTALQRGQIGRAA